jgi:hypothetical protein
MRDQMRLGDTLLALVVAPLGAAVPSLFQAMLAAERGVAQLFPLVVLTGSVWVLCLACGLLIVFPILAAAPRLRQPSGVVAAIWGGLVSLAFSALIVGNFTAGLIQFPTTLNGLLNGSAPGVLSGLTYAVVANRLAHARSAPAEYF